MRWPASTAAGFHSALTAWRSFPRLLTAAPQPANVPPPSANDSAIPKKYRDIATSGLEANVSDKEGTFDFHLKAE